VKDGLYIVTARHFVAGFVIRGGELEACAPILRRKFRYWSTQAKWLCP